MYGDTSAIRGLARTLRDRAADIRAEADSLVGQADAVHWTGRAADAMRRRARDRAGDLRRSAGLHDDAADALDRHAREVDHLKDLIASIEHRVMGLVHRAEHAVSGVVHTVTSVVSHVVPDAVDDWLGSFDPPPSGSKAWLDVEVPRS